MAGEVKFRCKRTVVSAKGVQPGNFYHLSVLDRTMELNTLRIVFYYQFPTATIIGGATSELRESLSELLSSYPVVTGRLKRTPEGHWMIKCNDAGVRMIEASARGTVEEWLQTVDRAQELKLTYWEDMYQKAYFWATFYVQITEFEGGGLAIGLSCSHLLADAASATILIKTWADTHLTGKMLSPPYFHPLPPRRIGNRSTDREPYMDLINHYKFAIQKNSLVLNSMSKNYATITLAFSDEMVRSCMKEARTQGANPMPFESLAALFWVCISRVKGRKRKLLNMSICLDMRKVLGLSRGFFGNAMVFNEVHGEGVEEGRVDKAAKAIGDVVEKMGNEGVMDLIEWLEQNKDLNKSSAEAPMLCGPQLVCANWEDLPSYDAVFEAGVAPCRVSYYMDRVIGEGQVLILPSPQGQGLLSRLVMVTLPEDQVGRLCEEALILSFSPTILMRANKAHFFESCLNLV